LGHTNQPTNKQKTDAEKKKKETLWGGIQMSDGGLEARTTTVGVHT